MRLDDKRNMNLDFTSLGIELGSTRIKAVLVDGEHRPIAFGAHTWENSCEGGYWTYSLDSVWDGLRACFSSLTDDFKGKYGVSLTRVGAIGVSAMMHGYLAFDREERLLAPFRTWRNTNTGAAAEILSELFGFNIPQRWSIAHLYQAILDDESHIKSIASMTTLAGYVHRELTGENVLGVGDASGMFPIDANTGSYDKQMEGRFNRLLEQRGLPFTLSDVLPRVLSAGESAGTLTERGARLLDPDGLLEAGAPLCPPEGDAGTGMTATNSVLPRTGNISAGTSVFAMIVLERALERMHPEIDMVTTPAGKPVAMVHCNTCTSDIDAWAELLCEAAAALGASRDKGSVLDVLYASALNGDEDCGGLLSYNYYAGEPITKLAAGRPLLARMPNGRFTLANLTKTLLYSAMATLRLGVDILTAEKVKIDRITGHGGFFKKKDIGQSVAAAALKAPVGVMETAGEGGAWGMALLAGFMRTRRDGETLEAWLDTLFSNSRVCVANPDAESVRSFDSFLARYTEGLAIERAAVENMR